MQSSKNPKTIGNFKIRRCIVRLQKMKPQPIKTRSGAATQGPTLLRKRSVAGVISSTPATSMKAKERLRTPIMQRNPKIVHLKKSASPAEEELPPTIAAGRSRRAHKPNPKYTSEDMVTPKILKSGKRDTESDEKTRRTSLSSLDDFFNKDSSEEELGDEDTEDTGDDKKYKPSRNIGSDSDFADTVDDSDGSIHEKRRPGRPRKHNVLPQRRSTAASSTSNILNKSAPAAKTVTLTKTTLNTRTPPTQLQQLRKTFGASTVSPLALGRKRKIEDNVSENLSVAPKRFVISAGASKSIVGSNINTRRSSPSQSLNGSRSLLSTSQTQKRETTLSTTQEKKSTPNVTPAKISLSAKLQQIQQKNATLIGTTATLRSIAPKAITSNKQSNISVPRTPVPTSKPKALETTKDRANKKSEETPNDTIADDFETMPTFTIVNINDIINKKGDVLISKAPAKKVAPIPDRRSISAGQQTNKVLINKITPDRLKNAQFRTSTPLVKKPTVKNVNNNVSTSHKVISKYVSSTSTLSSAGGSSTIEKKPAPRILNSMVGRKTKPVKPMIANMDITADSPSCSLSLFDDDEEIDDDSKADGSSSNETEALETTKQIQSKLYSSVSTTKSKSVEPKTAAKENSLAATNIQSKNQTVQSKSTDTRKLSPEKVIVSRQGDKIIKKITCFETWYVINIPADTLEEYERNNLNMPLIQLANATKQIKLPTEMWTTKVTLYQLSATTLAKPGVVPYTGDITDQNISEKERYKYQPSCVMFRRTVADRSKSQLPYDRAVIFKNKTFFTNIEGKNVKLVGAPSVINQISEVETLLHIVDSLTLESSLVEPAATVT